MTKYFKQCAGNAVLASFISFVTSRLLHCSTTEITIYILSFLIIGWQLARGDYWEREARQFRKTTEELKG